MRVLFTIRVSSPDLSWLPVTVPGAVRQQCGKMTPACSLLCASSSSVTIIDPHFCGPSSGSVCPALYEDTDNDNVKVSRQT